MRPGRLPLCAIVALTATACAAPIAKDRGAAPPASAAHRLPTTDTARVSTTTAPVASAPAAVATTAVPVATSSAPATIPAPATTNSASSATTAAPVATSSVSSAATPALAPAERAVRPASDPDALAAELAAVEARLHDPRTPSYGLALDALRQQLAFGRVASHPDWLPVVLAHLPTQWRATVEANSDAAIDLRALSTPVTELPNWQITPPSSPPATLVGYYREAEALTGVPWQVLAAIHLVESKMSRLRANSSAGAEGPMQFLPSTWASYGQGDINNDHDAILGAAHYLQAMGAPGDLAGALYHYNPSHDYVQAVLTYAGQMQADPSAFTAYYDWQVVFLLGHGEVVLPEGYPHAAPIPIG